MASGTPVSAAATAFTVVGLMQQACKATGKWGLYLAFQDLESLDYDIPELLKSVPYLSAADHGQEIADGVCVILCESEEECNRLYELTVGDDGPTDLNPYDGPARTYALTCNPQGELLNENT